ncbi:LPS export ABC transporter periplasmic protein LptC [Ramlibacter sp. PS3R-8]|uniref:LPS export ABC transporter periplasmic protein LptC n=1 Tax=Ramlibacter sp. PS3R-8 TaxID=3133437 RepID=UPI0030A61653
MTEQRGFGRAWDRLTIYLPIILMGLLALGTYWLARNTPTFSAPGVKSTPTHEPDHFLRNFSVKSFDPAGRLKTEIHGVEARHYPDTDITEIDSPRIRSYNQKGALTVATAKRALSNGDGSEVQLMGDAVVTRTTFDAAGKPQEPMEIRGEFLHAFMDTEQVKSNRPVRLTRGADVFVGDSMAYDNLDRVLQLEGRVRGTLQARPAP